MDIPGIGGNSLKRSSWTVLVLMCGLQLGILLFSITMNAMHRSSPSYTITHRLIEKMTFPWFSVINWSMFAICIGWGIVALNIPVRPREPKQKALVLFVLLIFIYTGTHIMWTVMFCKRCHNLYMNSLIGNLLKEAVETVSERLARNDYVDSALYLAVPVLNWAATPMVFQFYRDHFPPLHIHFWLGWNWSITAFFFGVVHIIINLLAIVVILGYKSAIDCGGDGNENVAPSKLAFFYSLTYKERCDVRYGALTLEDLELSDSDESETSGFENESSSNTGDNEEGSGGTKSSNSLKSYSGSSQREDLKRIPSYKPYRKRMVV